MSARIPCASVSLDAKVGGPREVQAHVRVPPASMAASGSHISAPHSGGHLPQRAVQHHTFRVQLAAVVPTHYMPTRAHPHHRPSCGHCHRASRYATGALLGGVMTGKHRKPCAVHPPRRCLRVRLAPVGSGRVSVHAWRLSGSAHRARLHQPNPSFNRTRVGVASSSWRWCARRLTLR